MNKGLTVNIREPVEAEALAVLRALPGVTATREPRRHGRRGQATLRFAGRRIPVALDVRRRANPAVAWQLVQHAEAHPKPPLLVIAGETTAKAREILREHGIGVLDGGGNAHVELPGLLFHLEARGERPAHAGRLPATRLRDRAGLVAQALLHDPTRPWHVKDVAEEAGVSMALAHRVMTRLERDRLVEAEGAGPKRVRRVANPTALLDVWAEEAAAPARRTRAYLLARTPELLVRDLGTKLRKAGLEYALTGAGAASLVAPFVTATPVVEVWVPSEVGPEELFDAVGADPVLDGHNIAFLQAKGDTPLVFREEREDLWLVDRFRLYADLLRDPRRGKEQAEKLRREVISF